QRRRRRRGWSWGWNWSRRQRRRVSHRRRRRGTQGACVRSIDPSIDRARGGVISTTPSARSSAGHRSTTIRRPLFLLLIIKVWLI
ncbi:Os02g0127300, partial [Oryza sativa Japonica Group]